MTIGWTNPNSDPHPNPDPDFNSIPDPNLNPKPNPNRNTQPQPSPDGVLTACSSNCLEELDLRESWLDQASVDALGQYLTR